MLRSDFRSSPKRRHCWHGAGSAVMPPLIRQGEQALASSVDNALQQTNDGESQEERRSRIIAPSTTRACIFLQPLKPDGDKRPIVIAGDQLFP